MDAIPLPAGAKAPSHPRNQAEAQRLRANRSINGGTTCRQAGMDGRHSARTVTTTVRPQRTVAAGRRFGTLRPMPKFIVIMAVLLVVFTLLAVFKDRLSR